MSGTGPGKRPLQQNRHRGLAASITTMKCAECGAEGPAGMKFCGQCGAPLVSTCPSCGADNPPEHKFCGHCGPSAAETGMRATATVYPLRLWISRCITPERNYHLPTFPGVSNLLPKV